MRAQEICAEQHFCPNAELRKSNDRIADRFTTDRKALQSSEPRVDQGGADAALLSRKEDAGRIRGESETFGDPAVQYRDVRSGVEHGAYRLTVDLDRNNDLGARPKIYLAGLLRRPIRQCDALASARLENPYMVARQIDLHVDFVEDILAEKDVDCAIPLSSDHHLPVCADERSDPEFLDSRGFHIRLAAD